MFVISIERSTAIMATFRRTGDITIVSSAVGMGVGETETAGDDTKTFQWLMGVNYHPIAMHRPADEDIHSRPGPGGMRTPYYRSMKVITVYSTKGGVGKTTTAVNLAWEASRNSRVLLWDLDPQGAATFVLNVKPKVKGGVNSLVSGKTGAAASVRATAYEHLDVLPADDSYRDLDFVLDAAKKSTHRLARILESVAKDYDVVVLDCPPGSSLVAENALRAADIVVVPLVPSPLSLRSLDQVVSIVAESTKSTPILAFLTMVDRRKTGHRVAAESMHGARPEVLAISVPATVVVERMGSERAPVAAFAPNTTAARAYADLWTAVAVAVHLEGSATKPTRKRHPKAR